MSRARTKASSASSRLPLCGLSLGWQPHLSSSSGQNLLAPTGPPFLSHTAPNMSSHAAGVTTGYMQSRLLPRCASQHRLSRLPRWLLPGSRPCPLHSSPHGGQSGPSQVSVSSHPSFVHSLRGCLSLQQPPKSFPRAPLFPLLTSGLASTSPRLRHGGLLATQEHALRATAWGPRPHHAEHAAPRCPVDQRPPSLTTR